MHTERFLRAHVQLLRMLIVTHQDDNDKIGEAEEKQLHAGGQTSCR